MSYRFLDGQLVTHGAVPGTEPPAPELVPITIIPQILVLCAGCNCAMAYEPLERGARLIRFYCGIAKCKYRGRLIEMPLQVVSARSVGVKEGLCDCEACVPRPEH